MNRTYLFNHKWMKAGWILIGISVVWTLLIVVFGEERFDFDIKMFAFIGQKSFFPLADGASTAQRGYLEWTQTSMITTVLPVMFFIGALLAAFSKEKQEDEAIVQIRANSFVWSMLVSYVILILLHLFVYGGVFFYVYLYGSYLFLVLYLIKFRLAVNKYYKENCNEE